MTLPARDDHLSSMMTAWYNFLKKTTAKPRENWQNSLDSLKRQSWDILLSSDTRKKLAVGCLINFLKTTRILVSPYARHCCTDIA